MAKAKPVTQREQNTLPAVSKSEDPMDDYQTKDDMNTLINAHKIINDGDKMAKVHKLAGRHAKAITAIKAVPSPDAPKFKSIDAVKKFGQDKYGGVGGKPKNSLGSFKEPEVEAPETEE